MERRDGGGWCARPRGEGEKKGGGPSPHAAGASKGGTASRARVWPQPHSSAAHQKECRPPHPHAPHPSSGQKKWQGWVGEGRGGETGGGGGGWRGKRGGASGSARALYVQPLPAQRWCLCFWRCSAAKCWAALVGAVRPPTPPADLYHSLTRATACADGGCGLVKGPAAARALRGGEGDRSCPPCSGAGGSAQTLASHTATLRCVYRCAFCHVPRPLPAPPPQRPCMNKRLF